MTSTELAKLKVQKALNLIQNAQALLGEASAELSGIIGAASKWQQVGKEYDRVHALWYKVEGLIHNDRLFLDGAAEASARERGLLDVKGGRS